MAETDKESESPLRPQVIDLKAEEVKDETQAPDSSEQVSQEPPPPSPARKRNWRLWGGVVLVAGAAVLGAWLYKSVGQSYWPSDAVTALERRVAALDALSATAKDQIAGLGTAIDGAKADAAGAISRAEGITSELRKLQDSVSAAQSGAEKRIGELESRIGDVASSLEALRQSASTPPPEGSPQPAVDTAALTALEQRVAALEQQLSDLKAETGTGANSSAVLSQALSDLKAKIGAGAAFPDEFARIATMVPAAPGLDVLEPHAQSGIATARQLGVELTKLSPTLPAPVSDAPAESEPGYWDWVLSQLDSVVTIRTLGAPDWRDVAARAAALADAGDLPQAIELLDKTGGDMPSALMQWRNRAKARVAAEAALEQVSAAVLRQLAAMGRTP